jgi:hypothetical protein
MVVAACEAVESLGAGAVFTGQDVLQAGTDSR